MSRVFRGACLNTVLEKAIDKKKEMETAILYAYRMGNVQASCQFNQNRVLRVPCIGLNLLN